jgi:hypothetical protein
MSISEREKVVNRLGFWSNIFSRVTSLFTRKEKIVDRSAEYAERVPVDSFGGSRKTTNGLTDGSVGRVSKYKKLNEATFKQYSPKALLNLLKHNHPDVSQAIWNFKIIGNSGYKARVTLMDGVSEHKSGQKLVDDFLLGLNYYNSNGFEKSRSIDRLVDMMFDSALLRGAVSMEMVMDSDFNNVLYFASVDPDTIDFKIEKNRLVPYQSSVKLDIPTFFFEGVDETETDPYGTSPFMSVVQSLAFHSQVLEDIKMVVHNQGYGKYDIKIVEEVLLKRMPINIRNNEAKKQEWLNNQLSMIIDMYSKLDPDAAFVHFDSVEVDMVDTAKATIDPQKLMAVIDTQILGALKQYSTLMGRRSQGQTEQYAKLEIKIFMKSVKRIRDMIENMISRALTKYLNINGMQGFVFFKFNDTEIRTELEKVNFEQIAITNAAAKRDHGWIDNDMASDEVTGHKAVAEPDKEMLGVVKPAPQGAQDETTPSNPTNSDSTNN